MSEEKELANKQLIFRISKSAIGKVAAGNFFIHARRFAEKSSANVKFKPKTGVPDLEEIARFMFCGSTQSAHPTIWRARSCNKM